MTLDLIKKGETFLINKFIIDGEERTEFVGLSTGEMVTLTNVITFHNNIFLCLQNDNYGYLIGIECASNIYGDLVNNNEKIVTNKQGDSSKNINKVLMKK